MWINLLTKEQYKKASKEARKECDKYNKRMTIIYSVLFSLWLFMIIALGA